MRDIKYILFILLLSETLFSQVDSSLIKNSSTNGLKRLGKSALQQNDPTSAISFFEAYLLKNKNDVPVKMMLGTAYMQIRDYDRAQHMFLNAYNSNKEKAPEALYYHALMMKSNNQYDSARYNFQKFKKEYKGSDKKLKRFASKEIIYCDSLVSIIGNENKISVQHLDTSINKVNTEGAPISLSNDLLVFTSLRTEKREYSNDDETNKGIKRKLYLATKQDNQWKFSGEYGNGFNDPDYNVGNAAFSPDRNRIYFTRCKLNYLNKMVCAIYVSEKNGDEWTEPVKLPKEVNNPKFTSTMPTVTSDPAKGNDVIYFVSNNKEGKGGLDIWYTVFIKKTKTYKKARNAGSKVNTAQDEITPFFDNETRSLYFSSNGLGGLGGFDIFKTKTDGKKWTGSENIGQPINTGADDIFYTISTARGEGFFVSNRKGGNALKNVTCCDDIYYYKQMEYVRPKIKGKVIDILDKDQGISNAVIEMYIKDKNTQEKFLVKTFVTDSVGNYQVDVEAGQEYYLVAKKEDFLGSSAEMSTVGLIESKEIAIDLSLIKKPKEPIHIPNILYEFDRSNMVESSKLSLDTTVLKLMDLNPELIIEIQAHTDSKGNDQYNLKLSQKRAESVVMYLKSKGIDPSRLRAQGYGETKPIAPNENQDGTDNPEGRAKNRRTDFKIIGVVDAEIINDSGVE